MSRLSLAFLLSATAVAALAQQTPAEVTPEQVGAYRRKIETGCLADARAGGLTQANAQSLCGCWSKSLAQSLGDADWQAAAFHALQRNEAAETQVLVPHVRKAAQLCAAVGR